MRGKLTLLHLMFFTLKLGSNITRVFLGKNPMRAARNSQVCRLRRRKPDVGSSYTVEELIVWLSLEANWGASTRRGTVIAAEGLGGGPDWQLVVFIAIDMHIW
jgi:hypothetical protein